METFKPIEYQYISPSKKQITCFLFENSLSFVICSKRGEVKKLGFKYEDIYALHLGLPDVKQHLLVIVFKDGSRVAIKSICYFLEDEKTGGLRRPEKDDVAAGLIQAKNSAYKYFVLYLHERLLHYGLDREVHFWAGNTAKKILVCCFMAIGLLTAFICFKAKLYIPGLSLVSLCSLLFYFNRLLSFKKKYNPQMIPAKYLPA